MKVKITAVLQDPDLENTFTFEEIQAEIKRVLLRELGLEGEISVERVQ